MRGFFPSRQLFRDAGKDGPRASFITARETRVTKANTAATAVEKAAVYYRAGRPLVLPKAPDRDGVRRKLNTAFEPSRRGRGT